MATTGVPKVKKKISEIFKRRKAALFAMSGEYALDSLKLFRRGQENELYWHNISYDAMNRMFTEPFQTSNSVGFKMQHGVSYGVYLELANDRRHEAIRPIIAIMGKRFKKAVNELYAG